MRKIMHAMSPLLGLALVLALLVPQANAAGAAIGADGKIAISDKTFDCISKLQAVRGFYVGNLLGDLKGTLAVAQSKNGGVYPVGSVIQLVPTEVMVKQPRGFNAATKDWEFFELDATRNGTKIIKRGFVEVVNRFGGNCFGCHIKARAEWDLVCETGHGCDPIPLTPAMFKALQRTDPRCPNADKVSPEDAQALKALAALTSPPPAAKPPAK